MSVRTIGAAEVARFPGADRDLSKALQGTPGVASTPNFRKELNRMPCATPFPAA